MASSDIAGVFIALARADREPAGGHRQRAFESACGVVSCQTVENNDSNPPRRADLIALRDRLRQFAEERDWVQFHSPKNLAMALSIEAAEIMEHFQWLTESQSAELPPETHAEVAAEIADVLIYVIRLADRLDVDLLDTVLAKIAKNEHRYPADLVRGRADKHTAYKKGSRS